MEMQPNLPIVPARNEWSTSRKSWATQRKNMQSCWRSRRRRAEAVVKKRRWCFGNHVFFQSMEEGCLWCERRYGIGSNFFGGGQAGFVYFSLGLAGKWQSPRIIFFGFTRGWVPEFVKEIHPPKKIGCTKGKCLESFSFFPVRDMIQTSFTSYTTPCTSKPP